MTANREAGFTLLEVLISLAFFSLISVILFQSLLVQYRALDRVDAAIEASLSDAVETRVIGRVISRSLVGWTDQPTTRFSGTADNIVGLTWSGLSSAALETAPYRVGIIRTSGNPQLIGTVGDVTLDQVPLLPGARFEYFGFDQKWRNDWPPQQDDVFFASSPEGVLRIQPLPDYVRIVTNDLDGPVILMVPTLQKQALPMRAKDLAGLE